MQLNEFQKMYELEDHHWWFRGKRLLITETVSRLRKNDCPMILDAGCGTGVVSKELARLGKVVGVDSLLEALKFYKFRGLSGILSDITGLPFPDNTFDFAIASDVLEHIYDDLKALNELKRVVKGDGYIIVTVPAHQFLYSAHDIALNHFRRYTKRSFLQLLAQCGLSIHKFSYTNFFILPFVFIARMVQKIVRPNLSRTNTGKVPKAVNEILYKLYKFEAVWIRKHEFFTGVSLFAVLKKK